MDKVQKPKRKITEKQKIARLANLARGRQKRQEMVKQKREQKEYDLSSDDDSFDSESNSDCSEDAFIISKAQKKTKPSKPVSARRQNNHPTFEQSKDSKVRKNDNDNDLKNEVNELKNIVFELANMQKKQNKTSRRQTKKSGGTKLILLPQNTPAPQTKPLAGIDLLELRKSLGML